jgi:hypothetical protein
VASVRMRHRDPSNKNVGITYVHVEKGIKVVKRKNLYKILLAVSVIINICLLIKIFK